jgi:hypothetical protein
VKASSTKLSLDHLRSMGWTAEVVERWVPSPHGQIRRDLWGFLDIVAIRDDVTMGVQTTTRGEMPKRVRKILASEHLGAVSAAGWLIVVHGWHQPRGPKTRYEVEEYVFPKHLGGVV